MGEVVRFPVRLRPIQPITAEQVDVRDALIVTLSYRCMECADRGVVVFDTLYGPSYRLCRCGGTEHNRVDLNDFGGAA